MKKELLQAAKTMAAEKLNGIWKFKKSENFDEYMKALGVSFAKRTMGNIAKPKITIKLEDSTLLIKSENAFHSFEINCTLAEEWDEATADGRKCKTTIDWDGYKLIHVQRWDGRKNVITRYTDECDDLIIELMVDNVKAKRIYTKD